MESSAWKLEKLDFVILTFDCFCADQGNKMPLLVERSKAMHTIPALFSGLRPRLARIADPCSTLVCVTFKHDITSHPSLSLRLGNDEPGVFGLLRFTFWSRMPTGRQ